MISLFLKGDACSIYRKACIDTFGDHTTHCRKLQGFKYMQDLNIYVFFDIFRGAGIFVKKEVSLNFLTDPQEKRLTIRPMNVMVHE
jgi:hypothetical protein